MKTDTGIRYKKKKGSTAQTRRSILTLPSSGVGLVLATALISHNLAK